MLWRMVRTTICEHTKHLFCSKIDASANMMFYNQSNGSKNFRLKFHTKEARERIRKSKIGKKRPDLGEYNRRQNKDLNIIRKRVQTRHENGMYAGSGNPMFGKVHSEQSKKIMSECKRGSKNPNYGRAISEETRSRMAESRRQYWIRKKENENAHIALL